MGTTESPRERAEALLVRCQDRLRRRIRWMMGDQARLAADTGDFLGEVTLHILEQARRMQWRDEAHFLALASRVARHLIVDRVRRPRVRRFESFTAELFAGELPGPCELTPADAVAHGEDLERVLWALERLPEADQLVLELRDFEGMPFRTIGARLGRSEGAVQMLHTRAVTRLGQLLRRRGALG